MYFDHYTGFEGDEELTFKAADGNYMATLWGGYFNFIMNEVLPNQQGWWESLALLYHTCTGWYSHSPFEIVEVREALTQLLACSSESWDRNILAAYNDLVTIFKYASANELSILVERS